MNKDFLNKKITLEDIKNIKIDLKSIKNIKNKKEILIGILIFIYIILIVLIGKSLFNTRKETLSEYSRKESKYNLLQKALSKEELQKKIEEIQNEKIELEETVKEVNNIEVINIIDEFKSNSPLKWSSNDKNENILPISSAEYANYDVYAMSIKNFSTDIDKVEKFFEYVKNYNKIVRIDSFNLKKQETGNLSGSATISFYFKKSE